MSKIRRRYERYPLFAITQVQVIGSYEHSLSCPMQSISKGGMGIYSYNSIEKGAPVSINIKFNNIYGERVSDNIEGRVVSIAGRDNTFCIGIEFNEELSRENKPNLYKHLDEFAKQN